MLVNLKRRLFVLGEITVSTLRPDILIWSAVEKQVLMIELTIPWEKGMTAAHESKQFQQSVKTLAGRPGSALWRWDAGALSARQRSSCSAALKRHLWISEIL